MGLKFKNLGITILSVMFILVLNGIILNADIIDNDGKARGNPYGDSKLDSSFSGSKYVDCYIPYQLTNREIGGYAIGAKVLENGVNKTGAKMSDRVIDYPVASTVMRETRYSYAQENSWATVRWSNPNNFEVIVENETGMNIVTDAKGNQYYLTAVQPFFFNHNNAGKDNFPKGASSGRGQLIDVILTDGTVIHFVCFDINASQHTNGVSDTSEGAFDVKYNNCELKYKQYNNLYSAQNGNTLEVWGIDKAEAKFREKYNLGNKEGQNRIAYYRMYNCYLKDSPERNGGVGKGVSFSYNNVEIVSSPISNTGNQQGIIEVGISEWDLTGMPENTSIYTNANYVNIPSYNSLSNREKYSLTLIKEDILRENSFNFYDTMRVSVTFLGLCTILYSVLLLVAYLFDRTNNVFDINLVETLSFGRLRYVDNDFYGKGNNPENSKIVKASVVSMIVGFVVVSGSVFAWVFNFLQWANEAGILKL